VLVAAHRIRSLQNPSLVKVIRYQGVRVIEIGNGAVTLVTEEELFNTWHSRRAELLSQPQQYTAT